MVVVGLESIPAVNNPREPKAQASDCFTSLILSFFCIFPLMALCDVRELGCGHLKRSLWLSDGSTLAVCAESVCD